MIIYANSGAYVALTTPPNNPFDFLLTLFLPSFLGLLSRESLERISTKVISESASMVISHIIPDHGEQHSDRGAPGQGWKSDTSSIREQWKDSIVIVYRTTRKRDGTQEQDSGTGTGFAISSSGHLITAAHVVSGQEDADTEVFYYASPGPNVNTRWRLQFIKHDKDLDVALLQLPAEALPRKPLPIASSSTVLVDDMPLFMLGFAKGLPLASAPGQLSNRGGLRGKLQTTIPINPGNSGSPIFSGNQNNARVIGIAVGGFDQAQGITYVTPSDHLRSLLSIAGVTLSADKAPVD
jgi:S1-C subfamily serine protease